MSCNTLLDSRSTFCPICGAAIPDRFLGLTISGRYRVDKRIAIGNFGAIYQGTELVSDREIALKIMHRELAADQHLVERFRREGVVLRKLLNPHVVATYEVGEADGLPFIAMELLHGQTLLAAFRAAGRLPWPRALEIAKGVCNALGEAHGLGIVHRDLKPANIFLIRDDFAKVLDFGIAKILSNSSVTDPKELTIMGTAVGTLEYMAPEQLMGGRGDPRTDIYTLGVVIYEVIVGRRPYNAAGLDLLTLQLTEPPHAPSELVDVPVEVDRLLLRCLAADVDDRFADTGELGRALDEVLALEPAASAPGPTALQAPQRAAFAPSRGVPNARPAVQPAPRSSKLPMIPRLIVLVAVLGAGAAVVVSLLR